VKGHEHEYTRLICGHCGNVINVPVYCGNRFCPECGKHRNKKIRYKLQTFLKTRHLRSSDSFKMLTLSVISASDLSAQFDHLIKSFRRLRQRAFWKKHVRGGCSICEVTYSDKGWHAHLHIIIESAYIPHAKLLDHWRQCSGGTGCHIKRIPVNAIVSYVTKYVTKTTLPEDLQDSASTALKSKRMFQPFGEWHNGINAVKPPIAVCGSCGFAAWDYLGNKLASELYAGSWQPLSNERASPKRERTKSHLSQCELSGMPTQQLPF